MTADFGEDANLDTIFSEVGELGLFQVINYFLICIPNILAAAYVMNYVFTANTLDYRSDILLCVLVTCQYKNIDSFITYLRNSALQKRFCTVSNCKLFYD